MVSYLNVCALNRGSISLDGKLLLLFFFFITFTVQNGEWYNIVERVQMVYKSLSSSQMHAMEVRRGWSVSTFVTGQRKCKSNNY